MTKLFPWFCTIVIVFFSAINCKGDNLPYSVAILKDKIGRLDPCTAEFIAQSLSKSGYSVTRLNASELADQVQFNHNKFSYLILTNSPQFPISAQRSLAEFVNSGGNLVLLGGQPFSDCLSFYNGQWVEPSVCDYHGQLLPKSEMMSKIAREQATNKKLLFSFDETQLDNWLHKPKNHASRSTLEVADGVAGKAMLVDIKGIVTSQWDLFESQINVSIPQKANIISFWAKGDSATPTASLELIENDGTRWMTTISLSTQWQYYARLENDFHFIEAAAQKRGFGGDHLALRNIKAITLGLSAHAHPDDGDHRIWFDEISVSSAQIPDIAPVASKPNIAYFNDYEPTLLQNVQRVSFSEECGFSADPNALNGLGDAYHVQGFTVRDKSKFIPVLIANDHGNAGGNAAGMLINYGGQFAGSTWVSFGLIDPNFYRGDVFSKLLVRIMQAVDKGTLTQQAKAENERYKAMDAKFGAYNYAMGTQQFSAQYQFTKSTLLQESARAVNDMGSNIFKCEITSRAADIYNLPKNSAIKSMRDLVEKDESYRRMLRMPFEYYLFWAYGFSGPHLCWFDGLSSQEKSLQYKEFYDLTKYLLTEFNNSGKTFYIGHWEGDWMLINCTDWSKDPNQVAIQGMIDWLNIRQQAIDDAKKSVPYTNVQVYHYTEVCLVQKAIRGQPTLTNDVLPKTNVDYVSYSSYDSADRSWGEPNMVAALKHALDYIESKLPAKKGITGKRVFIGEYGFPLIYLNNPREQDHLARLWTRTGLEWGCPFVLYWQFYCNVGDANRDENQGFWLINNKNKKQPAYITHYEFLQRSRKFVYDYRDKNGTNPSFEEFRAAALPWLSAD